MTQNGVQPALKDKLLGVMASVTDTEGSVGVSYGWVCYMGGCVIWVGVSYGWVCHMGGCVIWVGGLYE